MATPHSSVFQRWRWLIFIAGVMLFATIGQYRHQAVVGWSRWDTLTRDGIAVLEVGDFARAEPILSAALIEAERAGSSREIAISAHNLAGLRRRQHRFAESEQFLRRAIGLVERDHPLDETYLARLTNELASTCLAQQRPEDALVIIDRSIDLSRRSLGPHEPATVRRMQERAGILLTLGRVREAIHAATRATEGPLAPSSTAAPK